MSSISITGSVIDPVDRLGEANESRIAVPLGTIDSLLSRDPPADMRLAAERRSAVDAASASSAGPGVIGPAPGPNNVVPLRALEQPVLRGHWGPVATAGVARGIPLTGRIVDPADRRGEASEPGTAVTQSTIDSLLRDLSRDPPADTRLAAQLRSAVDAASAPSGVIGLSAAPPASAALQPAEDPVLKELDKLIARLDAGTAGLPPPPSAKPSAKTLKSRFFR